MSELNPDQRKAAEFKDGICAVIAVPGSGKTRTMMERIGMLVRDHGIPPEAILGLTFTRNAADEMRNRLVPVLGDLSARVFLSTIHSFCFNLLRMEGIAFNILAGKDQIRFLRDVIKDLKYKDLALGMVLREISLAKNNLVPLYEFRSLYTGDTTMLKVADVFEIYEQRKAAKMLLDFDDLLVWAYRLLNDDENVRQKYQEIFKHLLVDEFQDSSPIQLELLKLLLPSGNDHDTSFWVCGDDAQSIYGFTGASVGNILNFGSMFNGAEQIILNLNYRSTPQILQVCQNLIRHNQRQIPKVLKTDNPDGDDVVVLESSSEETEALAVVNEIVDLVERRGYQHSGIAVLYRANFQSRTIEEAFQQHKIPYHIQSGACFYDRREVKILLDYLRLIADPLGDDGNEALASIINVPNRYIGRKFVDQLKAFADKRGVYLYEALKTMGIDLPYIRRNVKELVDFLDPMIADAENLYPSSAIGLVRHRLDIDRYVTDEDIPSPDDVKIANLNQLQLAAARFDSIKKFLEYTETFQDQAVADNQEGVSLMTVHKAKGLEFPVVFVIGMVEGILPSKKGDLEEERRICFVAMSRAMKLLYLSHCLIYLGQPAKKSIFLEEVFSVDSEAAA